MNHDDHVGLLRPAGLSQGGVWADLGAGTGAFTVALRELIGPQAEIHAVDTDRASLSELERSYRKRFGGTTGLRVLEADFRHPFGLPPLDGLLMANSLHFHKDRLALLRRARQLLKSHGTLLVVEYNVDQGNPWVPFPLSFVTFGALAMEAGFSAPRLLATHPSHFLREFYAASAVGAVHGDA